jgi:hypothetical protein
MRTLAPTRARTKETDCRQRRTVGVQQWDTNRPRTPHSNNFVVESVSWANDSHPESDKRESCTACASRRRGDPVATARTGGSAKSL